MEERARGGRMVASESEGGMKPRPYNAQGSETEKEAEGEEDKNEKKRGGRAKRAHGGHVVGDMKKKRLDRPGRKRGGKIGADTAPLTSAAKIRNASEHDATDTGNAEED